MAVVIAHALRWLLQGDLADLEPMRATIFTTGGERLELYHFHVTGPDPHAFALELGGGVEFIPLIKVHRITARLGEKLYDVVLETGEQLRGHISAISFGGTNPERPGEPFSISIRRIERIHIIAGKQLRSCASCGYEAATDHPYCPVCGGLLELGPFHVQPEAPSPPAPVYRYRLDQRD